MKNDTETVSLGEIGFYVTRAGVGVGLPFGIAEDFANAVIWAQRTGIDLARVAFDCLNALDTNPASGRVSFARQGSAQVFTGQSGLSAIFAGPALADFWQLPVDDDCTLIAKNVDHPILIVGAMATAKAGPAILEWQNVSVHIASDGTAELAATNSMALESAGFFEVLIREPKNEKNALRIYNRSAPDLDKESRRAIQQGISVNKDAWEGLVALFRRCLVPSSAQSRTAGAGAGLVETD